MDTGAEKTGENHFDSVAQTWDQPHRIERAQRMFGLLSERGVLAANQTVMDFGCGTGIISLLLAKAVGHVLAVDASEGMLGVLRDKLAAADVQNITAKSAAETLEPADGIVTVLTLHHVSCVEEVLQRFHDALKPQGWLCVFDLDKEDGSFHQGAEGMSVPHHGFDKAGLSAMLNDAGFEVEFFESVTSIEKEVDGKPVAFPVFQLIARKRS